MLRKSFWQWLSGFSGSADWRRFRKWLIAFWSLFAAGVLCIVVFLFAVAKGAFGKLPTFEELENPRSNLATEIYSADSVLLGKFFKENRSNATFSEISPNAVNALIATEDVRFYEHSGIDTKALLRAVVGVLTFNSQGGASTISQQLAKNLFHDRTGNVVKRILQKVKEWIIAVRLESRYTKEEIIAMYFNTVEFSSNAYGIKSASRTYFNKLPADLSVEEAAVLVGMLKAPTAYNPRLHPEASKRRRNTVLAQMEKYHFIDKEAQKELSACNIELNFHEASHVEGPAPYFREYLRLWMMEWSKSHTKVDGSSYDIYKDGLKIYTTIDSRLQTFAEDAVQQHMASLQVDFFKHWQGKDVWKDVPDEFRRMIEKSSRYQELKEQGMGHNAIMRELSKPIKMKVFSYKGEIDTTMSPIDSIRYHRMFLQAGVLSVDPYNGHIKVWVGGTNYKYFQYDHITSQRQIGSTFKPFIYAAAIDNGYSPCFQILDLPVTFENYDNWTPQNSDNKYTGDLLTLRQCLAKSQNTCSAYLMKQIGPEEIIKLVRQMGIKSHIDTVPSICLGTPDLSVMEMVGSYTTFVNKGLYTQPVFITRIEDKDGNEIYHNTAVTNEVMTEEKAYVMVDLLRNVVNHGTAGRLRYRFGLKADIGGKTGTTQNQSDGWFIGITPELITGVWTGGEDRIVRFRSLALGQGASMALPVYGLMYQKLYADTKLGYSQDTHFAYPSQGVQIEMDCSKYTTAKDDKKEVLEGVYGSEYE
ncbi:MAG: transglycosylase domain-containing protein [Chitinophagales bacterium]|nr:transglycosylase domain-containing protein [Chitinophagales bacterium]